MLEHLKKLDGAEDFLDILRQMKEAVSQLPENPEALADTPSRNRLLLQKPKKQLLLNLLFHRSGFSLSQDLTV